MTTASIVCRLSSVRIAEFGSIVSRTLGKRRSCRSTAAHEASLRRRCEELVRVRAPWYGCWRKHRVLCVGPAVAGSHGCACVRGSRQSWVGAECAVVWQKRWVRVVCVRERRRILLDGCCCRRHNRACTFPTRLPWLERAHRKVERHVEGVTGADSVAWVLRNPAVGKTERIRPHGRRLDTRHGRVADLPYSR